MPPFRLFLEKNSHQPGIRVGRLCRYTEKTSEWTLDYPPLFAWFERLLTLPAALFDPAMLEVSKKPYDSPECVLFQVTGVPRQIQHLIDDLMTHKMNDSTDRLGWLRSLPATSRSRPMG